MIIILAIVLDTNWEIIDIYKFRYLPVFIKVIVCYLFIFKTEKGNIPLQNILGISHSTALFRIKDGAYARSEKSD